MNILYISKLSGNLWAGPNYSIPAQIKAQAAFDNVFWLNLLDKRDDWITCHTLSEYPKGRLASLPSPFNEPDIVIFEEVYCYPFEKIIKDVQRKKIPYIIIPRSSLTESAQNKKKWKKVIGNAIYFNRFIRNAKSIQYLTEQEYLDSKKQWSKKYFVIPNGIEIKDKCKKEYNNDKIVCTYIGRIESYQKGLDLLIEACSKIKDEITSSNCSIRIYGPDREGCKDKIIKLIQSYGLQNIINIYDAVFGEEKERVLLETDVFIMTSRFEGHPMGLIEALSYGLPCLITRGTNMMDEVQKADAGWTAENDTNSIKNALKEMLSQRSLLTQKGSNSLALSKKYSWDSIASESHYINTKLLE